MNHRLVRHYKKYLPTTTRLAQPLLHEVQFILHIMNNNKVNDSKLLSRHIIAAIYAIRKTSSVYKAITILKYNCILNCGFANYIYNPSFDYLLETAIKFFNVI